jgi:chemotaxis protein CheZ
MDGDHGMGLREQLRDTVRGEFRGMFDELQRFIDRRIAELSTEIHATVEMVDFSETNLTQQLARMHQQLSRVIALPVAATRNSGSELATVVQATEDAANRIMAAAEKIAGALTTPDPKPAITEELGKIFEACAFQDLTGQRIRRVLDQLKSVDHMLGEMVEHTQHTSEPSEPRAQREPIRVTFEITGNGPDLAQSEIDALMSR